MNWSAQTTPVGDNLYGLRFSSASTGYAVGTTGRIIKTTNGGITFISPVSNQVPENFGLSQNYPNPFNPVTELGLRITDFGLVNLTIFDAAGSKTETLFDDNLPAGTYKITWNASKYGSGVYFCRFTAGKFSQTIKMILIK